MKTEKSWLEKFLVKNAQESMAMCIIPQLHRAEFDENPRVFIKGVRATLIALGYEESFVEGDFRERLEDFYGVSCTTILI